MRNFVAFAFVAAAAAAVVCTPDWGKKRTDGGVTHSFGVVGGCQSVYRWG